eukprot:6475066-Amphidinium_carterae.1
MIKSNPERDAFSLWCASATSGTLQEVKVACHGLMLLSPQGSGSQYSTALNILRFLCKAEVKKYPDIVAAIQSKADDFVLQACMA